MKRELIIAFAILCAVVLYALTTNREGLEVATKIANEGVHAYVPPNTKVKYGADTRWSYRVMGSGNGWFKCDNNTFGDPAPGTGKACYKVETKPDAPPPPPVVAKPAAPVVTTPPITTPAPPPAISTPAPSAISELITKTMVTSIPTGTPQAMPPAPVPAQASGSAATAQSCTL